MVISHNLLAMNANQRLGITNKSKSKSTEKLASGYRINRAADDAAGLAISEKMRHQIRGMSQGIENTQDGVSLCQVADGALAEVNDMLNRMTELSIQAANGTNSESDRVAIQQEINELKVEITRIGKTTEFNGKKVFDNDKEPIAPIYNITKLISSPAIEMGYIKEPYLFNVDRLYYASASFDFSNINAGNIFEICDKSFSLHSVDKRDRYDQYYFSKYDQEYKFIFINGDGTQSEKKGKIGDKEHEFIIDIGNMTTGKEIVDKIYEMVIQNPTVSRAHHLGDCYRLYKNENKLTIYRWNYASSNSNVVCGIYPIKGNEKAGRVIGDVFEHVDKLIQYGKNTTSIQTSGESNDRMNIVIDYMNSDIIGVEDIDVTTEEGATEALGMIKKASATISKQRSRIGAYQNRLEHTIANENNIIENTTVAESQIRDTDMAKEMVGLSNDNILAQAGQSMLVQANQSKEGVLTLLGNNK